MWLCEKKIKFEHFQIFKYETFWKIWKHENTEFEKKNLKFKLLKVDANDVKICLIF